MSLGVFFSSFFNIEVCCCCSVAMSDSAIPWTAACQASLYFTISRRLPKLIFIESVMPSTVLLTKVQILIKFHKILGYSPLLVFMPCSRFHSIFNCSGPLQLHATNSDKFSFHFYFITDIFQFSLLWFFRYTHHLKVEI